MRSQHGEDRILLRTLLLATEMQPGTFLEIGAMDGDSFSNTLMLERCYNWTGLLIEADPINFAMLNESGRQATKLHAAVCADGTGAQTVPFPSRIKTKGQVVAGNLTASPVSAQLDVWRGGRTHVLHDSHGKPDPQVVRVPCRALSTMMREHGFGSGMTFLSLDVEGAEDRVLATVDPSAFMVVFVEWAPDGYLVDQTNTTKNGRVHKRMLAAGMVLHQHLNLGSPFTGGSNRVYLHPNLASDPLLMAHNKAKYLKPCLDAVEARARRSSSSKEAAFARAHCGATATRL